MFFPCVRKTSAVQPTITGRDSSSRSLHFCTKKTKALYTIVHYNVRIKDDFGSGLVGSG